MSSIFDRFSRVWNDGQRGFGKHSYNAAKGFGISDRELAGALSGFRIGKIAQDNINRGMNTSDLFSKYATIWDDNQLGFGKQAYDAAKAAGLSDSDIQSGIGGNRIGRVALANINSGIQRTQENEALRTRFDNQMSALQSQMAAQQQAYQTDLDRMKSTLSATMNPNTRESVLGVRGAGNDTSNTAKLNRQGMKGSFARTGLRIKSLNI